MLRYLNNDDCALGVWLSALDLPRYTALNSGVALSWNINNNRWQKNPDSFLFILDAKTMSPYWDHLVNVLNATVQAQNNKQTNYEPTIPSKIIKKILLLLR